MEMGGGSTKAIKKKKTALPWKCSHLGGERMARKEAAATEEWGPWGWGDQAGRGTHRTADPEPRGVGRLPGTEAVQTGREIGVA